MPQEPMREMVIYGVSFDVASHQPIVLLKTADENRYLPIWVGLPEAQAILLKLQNAIPVRPMTHDLLTDIIGLFDAEITRVTVTELRDNTFYGRITLTQNGSELEIDSRPSDAIALAVRFGATIYAADDVIDVSSIELEGDDGPDEAEQQEMVREFKRFLDEVSPDEFAAEIPVEEEEEKDG